MMSSGCLGGFRWRHQCGSRDHSVFFDQFFRNWFHNAGRHGLGRRGGEIGKNIIRDEWRPQNLDLQRKTRVGGVKGDRTTGMAFGQGGKSNGQDFERKLGNGTLKTAQVQGLGGSWAPLYSNTKSRCNSRKLESAGAYREEGDVVEGKVREDKSYKPFSFAIVGGGVIGLTTALRISEEFRECRIVIIAEHIARETTSEGAGGLWKPFALSPNQDPGDIHRWGSETFDHYMKLSQTSEAPRAGIMRAPAYELYREPVPDPDWAAIVPGFRHLSQKELQLYDPQGEATFGFAFETIIAEGRLYLPWLLEKLKQIMGDRLDFQRRKIKHLDELSGYDAIVNCTGLGSRELVGDTQMYPIRGHVVRVKAPWVVHHIEGVVSDHNRPAYIIPNTDSVILGGTKDAGNEDLIPREEDRKAIIERCCKTLPALSEADIIGEWVGLRPGRKDGVRLELEQIQMENEKPPATVVHNYGHGGSGLTLAWGCAGDVVRLLHGELMQDK